MRQQRESETDDDDDDILSICQINAVICLQDDIGLGAVVGSAVFNIMFVIGMCALFAESVSPQPSVPI